MKPLHDTASSYFATLEDRAKKTRVHRPYQLVGLEIAVLLRDLEHKSLYIKLAKERNPDELLSIAKSIAERRGVENRGAYFMRVIGNAGGTNQTPMRRKR